MPRALRPRPTAGAATLVLALTLGAAAAAAQARSKSGVGWGAQAEVSGSLFFGNTSQTVVATRAAVERADSTFALKSEARFTYGESSGEDRKRSVSKRSWLATLSFDAVPFDDLSPFVVATVEHSLEKRIDLRYSAGVGNRFGLVRSPRADVRLSVALLGEQSRTRSAPTDQQRTSLVRWATNLKTRHDLTKAVTITSETAYRPEFQSARRFTVTSNGSVGFRASEVVTLKFSVMDNYDSEATGRGAKTNNDGQVVVGVLTAF